MLGSDTEWISPWWQAALIPKRWDVCGVAVPSLSVWHVYAMEQIGNRYFVGGGEPDRDDAAGLLMFAQRDYAGGHDLFFHGRARVKAMWRVTRRIKRQDAAFVLRACREYVETCTRHGRRIKPKGPGVPAGTPEAWAIVAMLRGMGDDIEAAWNTTYAVGRALLDAIDERTGNATMTPGGYGEYMADHWADMQREGAGKTRTVTLSGRN